MMKDFKLGIRLLKYGYGIKPNLFFAGLFLAMGICFHLFVPVNGVWMTYLMASASYLVQILSSLHVTAIANSSSRRKVLYTKIPVLISLPFYLLLYVAGCLVELWMLYIGRRQEHEVVQSVIMAGLIMVGVMIYMGGAFKYFAASAVMVCVVILFIIFGGNFIFEILEFHISIGAAMLTGLVAVPLGAVLQYLLTLLLYRHPASKAAQMRKLKKYM